VRAVAVSLVGALFSLPLLEAGGLAPGRGQGRSLRGFAGRILVAVVFAIGVTEIFVSPTDLATTATDVGGSLTLVIEIVGLILLHAGIAAIGLVGVPDVLVGRRRARLPSEGPLLFLACLLPFGVVACIEAAVNLIAAGRIIFLYVLCLAFALDAAAMLFAIFLAFAIHRRFVPTAAYDHVSAVFD
jgi:hypothetical protein